MFDPVTAAVGVFGVGSDIAGGILGANAAEDAANERSKYLEMGIDKMMPWYTSGKTSLNELSRLMEPGGYLYDTEFTPANFLANLDPAYKWRQEQGGNAIAAQAAALGLQGSGTLGTALEDYAQRLASEEYGSAYGRFQNSRNQLYNRLMGLSEGGRLQSSGIANLLSRQGEAKAQGILGEAEAYQNMISGIGNSFTGFMGAAFPGTGGGGGGGMNAFASSGTPYTWQSGYTGRYNLGQPFSF